MRDDKNYDTAKLYFRKALQVRPDYKPANNNLMRIYKRLNQDSITNLLKATSFIDPSSDVFMNDMGMAFYEQKRYDSAVFIFAGRCLKIPPVHNR